MFLVITNRDFLLYRKENGFNWIFIIRYEPQMEPKFITT